VVKSRALSAAVDREAAVPSPVRATSFTRTLIANAAGLVAVLGLALLLAMTLQGVVSTKAASREEIGNALDRATERLQILIRAAEMTADSVERAARVAGLASTTLRATLENLLAAFEQRPELSYIGIALPGTGEYGTLERTADGTILLWLFPGTRANDPVTRIFALTERGFVLREERSGDGYDPRGRPFYQAGAQAPPGGTWIPGYQWIVHSNPRETLWGLSYVRPLRDATGRLVGVLDTDIDLPALNRFLDTIATEYRSRIQVIELGDTPRLIAGPAVTRAPLPLPDEYQPLLRAVGTEFADRIELGGERRWTGARRMELTGGISWLMVASRTDPFIAAPLRRQLYQVLAVGLAIVIGLVLLSIRTARRLGRPLQRLQQRVGQIERGELQASVAAATAAGGFQETRQLGEAFSRMAVTVQQRERELSVQNSRLRSHLENTPLAVIEWDAAGRITSVNVSAIGLFGRKRAALVGQPVLSLVAPPDQPMMQAGIDAARLRSREKQLLARAWTADGRMPDCEWYVTALESPDGGEDGACALVLDVSQLRQAREQQAASLGLKGAIFDSTDTAIFSLDERLGVIEWNSGAERLFGVARERIIGQAITTAVASPDGPVDWAAILAAPGTGSFCFLGAHGAFDAELRRVTFSQNGREIRTVLINDTSARAQAEQALRDSVARFHAVARATGDAVWDWDLLTNASWRNENYQALFGTSGTALAPVVESWKELIHPEDRQRVLAHLQQVIDGDGELWAEEFRMRRGDGGYADVLDRGIVIRDAAGRGVRMVGTIQDVTERRQTQARLLAFNAELEQRVAQRTRELESLNRELESFCYSVSHDLRAPLRGIAGFTGILAKNHADALDTKARGYLDRVLAATHRMGELIDDLLDLSRVSRDEMRRQTVDLSQLAREVLANLQQGTPERTVEIHVEDGLAAEGDARLLRAMLENLLGNAWKFTSKTTAARIAFTAAGHDGGARVFAVTDNGAGFDMRYASKLFGPFQRLHRTEEFPGTGIGLATVQRIVGRHGGRIWAEAAPGKGATFRFTLEPATA
jgi:PAS domain S-box-containing protein